MTPKMRRLAGDAERAGMPMRQVGNCLTIGREGGPAVSVYLSPVGGFYIAHRADTGDLSVCTAIRSIRAVRRILNLPTP